MKTQILRNCRPSETLFFKRFLSSQLLSGFLEASSRRLIACEPLLRQPTDDPADEVETEADKKSIRIWSEKGGKSDQSEDFSVRESANGGLKRTLRAHKLGDEIVDSNTPSLVQVKNGDDDDDDDDDDNDDVVSDVDQVIENTDKAVLSKSYSQPFQLIAIIKKMRLKNRVERG
jgi:hypothetical protein